MSKNILSSAVVETKAGKRKYRVTDQFIDALRSGELSLSGVTQRKYYGNWYECVISIGRDYTANLQVPEETILANPEFFEEIKMGSE